MNLKNVILKIYNILKKIFILIVCIYGICCIHDMCNLLELIYFKLLQK